MNTYRPKLILHFDINKTILMTDTASHKGSEEALVADIIAGMAWGIIEHTQHKGVIEKSWRCMLDELSVTAPREDLVTYR